MIFHVAMGHQVLYSNRDFQENVFPPIAHFSIYPHLSGRQHEKTFCIPFWAWGITCRELLQGFIMKSNWKGALWHEMLLGDLSMPSSPTRPPSGWAGWALQGFGCLHLTSIKDPSPSCRKSRLSLEKASSNADASHLFQGRLNHALDAATPLVWVTLLESID